jgi:hypothetical protein
LAFALVNDIGDAFVDALLRAVDEGRPRLRRMAEWIADAAQPPRGVRLVADDGSEFSGVVLLERNRPVLMLALRVAAASHPMPPPRPQVPYATPYERPLWSPYGEDGPIR